MTASTRGTDHIAVHRAGWRESRVYSGRRLGDEMDLVAARVPGTTLTLVASDGAEQVMTIAELRDRGRRMAVVLQRLGLVTGDRVAVQLPDGAEALVVYRAVLDIGAVIVPIPMVYREAELGFIVADSETTMAFLPPSWRGSDAVPAMVARESGAVTVIELAEINSPGSLRWSDLVAEADTLGGVPPVVNSATPSSESIIIYTSGSTSAPKGARHSHEALLFELQQAVPEWEGENRWLSAFPFGHMSGILEALRPLVLGGDAVVLERWDARLAIDVVARHRLTTANLGPYHLVSLLEELRTNGSSIGLRNAFVGSTAVPASLIEAADAAGVPAYRIYGSSEHPTTSWGASADPLELRSTTDGRLMGSVEVLIVDEQERPLPQGSEGAILSRGPDLFLGYTDGDATAAVMTDDGFYRTGDLGTLVDGLLTITGRLKDVIIRNGENLSPKEIEDVLVRHPAVIQAAVVGRPDPAVGERAWAFVTTRDRATLTLDEVIEFFSSAGVARQKTPEGIIVVDDFPLTASGKILKPELRRRLSQL